MPNYDYHCPGNNRTVEVRHRIDAHISTWGELCYAAQIPLGDTDFFEPVRKVISAPAVVTTVSNTELRDRGFTKLVKRDHGVYENVTASGHEQRYMKAGKPDSVPDLSKKIRD
jgi:hypothetical protein